MLEDLYLESKGRGPRLRVGLLVDGDYITAAAASVIDQILACNFADIVLIVRHEGAQRDFARHRSWRRRLLKLARSRSMRRRFLYAAYTKIEAWLAPDHEQDPLRMVDCSRQFAGIESLTVKPEEAGFVHRFRPEDVEAIRAHKLDVLLRFGFNILKGDILSAARCGIWSYHHGDPEFYRGAPPQFWEMAEGNPLCGVVLQILDEHLDGGTVLEKGLFATDLSISLRRNRIQVFWGSAHFVIAKLKTLHERGFQAVLDGAQPAAPYRGRREIYRTPTNVEVLRWFIGTLCRKVLGRLSPQQVEHWQIAVRVAPAGEDPPRLAVDPATGAIDLTGFRFVSSPPGRVYADPFLFCHDGVHYVFFEEDYYDRRPAVISVARIVNGKLGPAQVCLNTGSHLSYPQVFAHDGQIYMVPESSEAQEVALYRAVDFPLRWEKLHVLHHGSVVDTTIWHEGGIWYLFATLVVPRSSAASLHLFTATELAGPWVPHPSNPLSYDVRSARGAGPLFRREGVLYRPSQDCSGTYGRAIGFYAVDVLTREDYAEHQVVEITPADVPPLRGAVATGIHTYHACCGIEVIDAKFRVAARLVR